MENTTQVLAPGMLLDGGKYRIERVLGQGGFGITYLATDLSLDRKVAVKEFFPETLCFREGMTSHVTLGTEGSRDFVERLKGKFLKEARNIAKFDHPGIIRIYAAFEDNNTAYYVMEYIEGQPLSAIVRQKGPLGEAEAVTLISQVGEALDYIHARRINHLDVKPANIMVRYSGEPVLIDFGLSKQYDSAGQQTSTTPVGLSHGFAPLEQYNDGGVGEFTPATDIYSLAASLYFALTGKVPPQAPQLVEAELTFPSSFPGKLVAPIRKAMANARRQRHATAMDFIGELTAGAKKKDGPKSELKPVAPARPAGTVRVAVISSVVALLAAAVVLVAWLGLSGGAKDIAPVGAVDSTDVVVENVVDMEWQSPLGPATYTGQVVPDSVPDSDRMLPHGKGVSRVTSGKMVGCIYDGEFSEGRMEGQATYTLPNGDTFVGIFRDNAYKRGRYTVRESGEYFEGTYKDGAPDKGTWYNRNGQAI